MNNQLNLALPPTNEEKCMMCHFSTECEDCCKKCKKDCNAKQYCSLQDRFGDQTERLESWLSIIRSNFSMNNLKKFIK